MTAPNTANPYNATITGKILITPDLMILRVRTDEPRKEFHAGQYTTIGVLGSEERSVNSVLSIENPSLDELIARPYSIASAAMDTQNFEFYISQVKSGQLTPRLFNMKQGQRMWVDHKILGIFNLHDTPKQSNIVMLATGTGLAPYISFLRSHLSEHKETKLCVIHGAAYPWDLGYLSELEFIDNNFENFFYFPTLLKADESWTGLRGYIQEHLSSGLLEEKAGVELNPQKTHFFLCGNPRMIDSVSSLLLQKGYSRHSKDDCGALHIEEY